MYYLTVAVLLALSALFSGLTLGLMGLNAHTLKRKMRLGDVHAARIYPIRKRGNELLATLLIGNVAVNAALSIFLGSIASGVTAGVIATILIVIFGEIVPQAVFSRHALRFGAFFAIPVRALMMVTWPITHPIGHALDHALGEELPTVYSTHELMEIISEHEDSEHSSIDQDEERIVHGALQFSHKTVRDIMTPLADVMSLSSDQILDFALRTKIAEEGYSRYPVLEKYSKRILGILYAKDVLVAPHNASAQDVCDHAILRVKPGAKLDSVLARILQRKLHMAIVYDDDHPIIGVVTLEDIIEEVIQQEILDEDDEE